MNKTAESSVTVDDFSSICRVCLQSHEEMVDIFRSGMDNQLMEVTNLKVSLDDQLPKTVCQSCTLQMDHLSKFLNQAKSSDEYLRSLLNNVNNEIEQVEELITREKRTYKRKSLKKKTRCQKPKDSKKYKKDLESEKMYLILVPNVNNSDTEIGNEICIKDLNYTSDNFELTQLCRSLVKNQLTDHTYPKDIRDFSENEETKENNLEKVKSEENSTEEKENKTFKVNLVIFECTECKKSFEDINDLTTHFLLTHNSQPPFMQCIYTCPICYFGKSSKTSFINHLQNHKEEGYSFIKVNSAGEEVPLKESEKDVFLNPHMKECRIFRLNTDDIVCSICNKKFKSQDVSKHLQLCSLNEVQTSEHVINFICPVCQKVFENDKEDFTAHLVSHQKENVFYIKVDETGQPVNLKKGDEFFTPYDEAVKISQLLGEDAKTKIFKIINVSSCDKCNYEAKSFKELCEHYNIHNEKLEKVLLSCPVCLLKCDNEHVAESIINFYEHLKVHKNKGFYFVLVNKCNSLSNLDKTYSDIFTQSLVFYHLANKTLLVGCNDIWYPELRLSSQKSFSSKYTCDLCQSHFKKKQELIKHLKSHQMIDSSQEISNYVCEKCGKKCFGKSSYKKHFLKHSKGLESCGKRPTCSICNKTFANRGSLNGHIRQHLEEGVGNELEASSLGIICEKCGKSFSNNASLAKHKKLHSTDKENSVLKCEICNRDFFRQSSFDRHKSAHLNPNYFECEICKLPLSSIMSLQKHSELHRSGSNTFDCRVCKVSFLTKDSLTAHQTHTGHYLDRKPLECNVCHEKFFIGRKFTEHIKTHPKYKISECTLCGKRLSTVQSLMLHMGRHFESNSILCPHCGKQFFEEKNYHRHLLTHEGIKPFSCNVEGCGKSFYTLFELNRHKKYHNNTRDFGCPYCSKSFHEANHLTVHVRTHTGERPYTCPHCNKGFVTRTRCKHHIKLIHQGVGYELIQSNISKKVTVFEAIETIV